MLVFGEGRCCFFRASRVCGFELLLLYAKLLKEMGKDRNGSLAEKDLEEEARHRKERGRTTLKNSEDSEDHSGSETVKLKKRKRASKKGSSRRRGDDSETSSYDSDSEDSDSEFSSSSSSSEEESEGESRRRRRREKRKRREREYEREKERKKREKEKRRKRRRRDKEERDGKKKKEKNKEKKQGKKGPVTNSWGKYGIIRETDMWNKRPEFTAWLQEVKQVNLETLPNWEEKQMFKEFMEDHNTATFPSKKYYSLDMYHQHKLIKEMKKGSRKVIQTERTVFDDEEQKRKELLRERERQKEEQVEALKRSMQSGMAQAMKDQAQLREEMNYQYRLGNFEAAAAIQRRLDPDAPP